MTPEILTALGAVFVTVLVMSTTALWAVMSRSTGARRRLGEIMTTSGSTSSVAIQMPLAEGGEERLKKVGRFVPKSPKDMTKLQRRLAQAGYHGTGSIVAYALVEYLLPLALVGLVLFFFGWNRGWLGALFAGIVGYLLPGFVLAWRVEKHKRLLSNGLPDALDLIIVCVEAGMSLDQAILKTSDELRLSHPDLAEELSMVNTEIRAGKPRLEAFRNLASRTQVDDVRALVSMLTQTDRFGTSVAQALRIHAAESRSKRRQRAEERAAKLGVKLVFPLVLCLFPALYVVTLGPAVLQFVRVFFGQVVAR